MTAGAQRSLSMLATALEIENRGRDYYDKAAATSRNPVGQDIWVILRDYEVEHVNKIKEIYQALQGGGAWSEELAAVKPSGDLTEVFRKLARERKEHTKADAGEVEALNVGVDFESASVKFYEDQLAEAEDPLEKKFISAMVAEERGHLNLLTDMRYYYEDPEGWLMEKGRGHLDGA